MEQEVKDLNKQSQLETRIFSLTKLFLSINDISLSNKAKSNNPQLLTNFLNYFEDEEINHNNLYYYLNKNLNGKDQVFKLRKIASLLQTSFDNNKQYIQEDLSIHYHTLKRRYFQKMMFFEQYLIPNRKSWLFQDEHLEIQSGFLKLKAIFEPQNLLRFSNDLMFKAKEQMNTQEKIVETHSFLSFFESKMINYRKHISHSLNISIPELENIYLTLPVSLNPITEEDIDKHCTKIKKYLAKYEKDLKTQDPLKRTIEDFLLIKLRKENLSLATNFMLTKISSTKSNYSQHYYMLMTERNFTYGAANSMSYYMETFTNEFVQQIQKNFFTGNINKIEFTNNLYKSLESNPSFLELITYSLKETYRKQERPNLINVNKETGITSYNDDYLQEAVSLFIQKLQNNPQMISGLNQDKKFLNNLFPR